MNDYSNKPQKRSENTQFASCHKCGHSLSWLKITWCYEFPNGDWLCPNCANEVIEKAKQEISGKQDDEMIIELRSWKEYQMMFLEWISTILLDIVGKMQDKITELSIEDEGTITLTNTPRDMDL